MQNFKQISLTLLLAVTVASPWGCSQKERCDNGIDDDNNGKIDCFDEACYADPVCIKARCGNGIIEPEFEECDPAATLPTSCQAEGYYFGTPVCNASCELILPCTGYCGDNLLQSGEQCDDGEANSDELPNHCRTNCSLPVCGDNITDTETEECDKGTANSDGPNAECRQSCTLRACGDGILDPAFGETCDNGTLNSDFASNRCRTNCTLPSCGDNVIDGQYGEQCDNGTENSDIQPNACRADCTRPGCGDGVTDPSLGEQCDNGAQNSNTPGDDCRTDCTPRRCGDNVVDPSDGEACDLGSANSDSIADRCRTNCTLPFCGDNVVDPGYAEECDEGDDNALSPDTCRPDCSQPYCGDLIVDSAHGEQCDNGAENGDLPDFPCRSDCTVQRCGDSVVDTGEQCDNGAANSNLSNAECRLDCTPKRCGDQIVDTGEQCDSGTSNADIPDAPCRTDCTHKRCGDSIVDSGEQCDLGSSNSNSSDALCRTDCKIRRCGDGIVDTGEQCDLGSANSDTAVPGCSTTCLASGVLDFGAAALQYIEDGARQRIYILLTGPRLIALSTESLTVIHEVPIACYDKPSMDMSPDGQRLILNCSKGTIGPTTFILVDLDNFPAFEEFDAPTYSFSPRFKDNQTVWFILAGGIRELDLSQSPYTTSATPLLEHANLSEIAFTLDASQVLLWYKGSYSSYNYLQANATSTLEETKDFIANHIQYYYDERGQTCHVSPSGKFVYNSGVQYVYPGFAAVGFFGQKVDYEYENNLTAFTTDASDIWGITNRTVFDVKRGVSVSEHGINLGNALISNHDGRVYYNTGGYPSSTAITYVPQARFTAGLAFNTPPSVSPLADYSFSRLVADPARDLLYGIDSEKSVLVKIDPGTGLAVDVLSTYAIPKDLEVSTGGEWAYVSHLKSDLLLKVDLESFTVDSTPSIQFARSSMAVASDDMLVFGRAKGCIQLYDTLSNTMVDELSERCSQADHRVFGNNSNTLFASHDSDQRFVFTFTTSGTSLVEVASGILDDAYYSEVLSSDGNRLYWNEDVVNGHDIYTKYFEQRDHVVSITHDDSRVTSYQYVYKADDFTFLGNLPHYAKPQTIGRDGHTLFYMNEGQLYSVDLNSYTPTPLPQCGNGVVEGEEECDDGNSVNYDGCTACIRGASSLALTDASYPFLSVVNDNKIVVGYDPSYTNQMGLSFSHYSNDGSELVHLSTHFRSFDSISSPTVFSMALTNDGTLVVAYNDFGDNIVRGIVFDDNGVERETFDFTPNPTIFTYAISNIKLLSDGDNNHFLLFMHDRGAIPEVYGVPLDAQFHPVTAPINLLSISAIKHINGAFLNDGTILAGAFGYRYGNMVKIQASGALISSYTIDYGAPGTQTTRNSVINGNGQVAVLSTIDSDWLKISAFDQYGSPIYELVPATEVPEYVIYSAPVYHNDGRLSLYYASSTEVTGPYLVRRDFAADGTRSQSSILVSEQLISPPSSACYISNRNAILTALGDTIVTYINTCDDSVLRYKRYSPAGDFIYP